MVPLRYNVRSVMERRTTSLMTVLGVGLVAMMFVLLFGFVGGLKQTLTNNAGAENWIVMSRGAVTEGMSNVTHEQVEIIRARPEVLSAAWSSATILIGTLDSSSLRRVAVTTIS